MFRLIYRLSKKKLEILQKYLEKNFKKGFFKESQSSTGYLVLFIPIKNQIFYLYINYKKLNNVTIKKQYLSLNISQF